MVNNSINEIVKIIRLIGPKQLVVEEQLISVKNIGKNQIFAKTLVSAISPGTELAAYVGLPALRNDVAAYPRLQGYCNVSEVLVIGEEIESCSVGDRIVTFQSHRSHFLIDSSDIIAIVPSALSSAEASVTYLFHLGYNALLKAAAAAGSNVAVIGLGALGLGSIAICKMSGINVIGVSDQDCQHKRALKMGASLAVKRDKSLQAMKTFSMDPGIDLIILTSNSWDDYLLSLKGVRKGGQICLLGFPGRDNSAPNFNPFAPELFYQKQLTIKAVGFSPASDVPPNEIRFTDKRNMQYLLGKIADGDLPATQMISGEYSARLIETAYGDLLRYKKNPVTYVLKW